MEIAITTPLEALVYSNADDTMESTELIESRFTTRVLAYELANAISLRTDNPLRVVFLDEYESGPQSGWYRGSICRALATHGESVARMERRRW